MIGIIITHPRIKCKRAALDELIKVEYSATLKTNMLSIYAYFGEQSTIDTSETVPQIEVKWPKLLEFPKIPPARTEDPVPSPDQIRCWSVRNSIPI